MLITTSHGNGISPKLSKNLHKVRQVGTLLAAKTSSVGKAATFPEREGIFAEWEHFPLFRFKKRGGDSCRVDKKMNPTKCRIHFLSVDISTFVYLIYQDNLFDYALFFTKRRTTQAISPAISIPKITDTVTRALLSF